MQFPLIKHAVGVFGTCDASPKTLKKTLKDRSVVLYPGGIAELFLCDDKEERIFVKRRKGFVKVRRMFAMYGVYCILAFPAASMFAFLTYFTQVPSALPVNTLPANYFTFYVVLNRLPSSTTIFSGGPPDRR